MISPFIYVKYRTLHAFEDINRNLKPFIKAIKTPVPMSTDNAHQLYIRLLLACFCSVLRGQLARVQKLFRVAPND